MKIQTVVLGLVLSTGALADFVSIDEDGKNAYLMGSFNSTTSEILEFVDMANDYGYRNDKGADIFTKDSGVQGTRSYTIYTNKFVEVALDSAFTVIYKAEFKGQAGDMVLDSNKKVLTVTGQSARVLMGALTTATGMESNRPVGVNRVQTKSGKVVCSKVVVPRSVASCVIKLK
jgi:hypothetical protein